MFEIMVRYEAMAVLLAEGLTVTELSRLLAVKEVKGSLSSPEGEVRGVAPAEMALALVSRRLEELRAIFEEVGEARRDNVLRKVDLRFGGGEGSDCMSMGNTGSFTPGWDSESFRSSSTISLAVRVRVKL
jgi:hypothetical protein